jgi:hypothetical protein
MSPNGSEGRLTKLNEPLGTLHFRVQRRWHGRPRDDDVKRPSRHSSLVGNRSCDRVGGLAIPRVQPIEADTEPDKNVSEANSLLCRSATPLVPLLKNKTIGVARLQQFRPIDELRAGYAP